MKYYNNNLIPIAKELRKKMTNQEKHLWYDFLRSYPNKIYKQKVIDNFVVDFYCHSAKIVIEVDGSQHYEDEGKVYDNKRTEILNKYGIEVIRFSNMDVDKNFEGVCNEIGRVITERITTHEGNLYHLDSTLSVSGADSSPVGRAQKASSVQCQKVVDRLKRAL